MSNEDYPYRISSPELAETMAYAEKPYMELIIDGRETGDPLSAPIKEATETALKEQAAEMSHLMASAEISRSIGELLQLKVMNDVADDNFVPYFGDNVQSAQLIAGNAPVAPDDRFSIQMESKKNDGSGSGVGENAVSKVAALIATSKEVPTQQDIAYEVELSRPSVSLVYKSLTEAGLLASKPGTKTSFEATDKFHDEFSENLQWQEAAQLRTLVKLTGYSPQDFGYYMRNLLFNGMNSSMKDAAVSENDAEQA